MYFSYFEARFLRFFGTELIIFFPAENARASNTTSEEPGEETGGETETETTAR